MSNCEVMRKILEENLQDAMGRVKVGKIEQQKIEKIDMVSNGENTENDKLQSVKVVPKGCIAPRASLTPSDTRLGCGRALPGDNEASLWVKTCKAKFKMNKTESRQQEN